METAQLVERIKDLEAQNAQLEQWLSALEKMTWTFIQRGQTLDKSGHTELFRQIKCEHKRATGKADCASPAFRLPSARPPPAFPAHP